MLQAHFELESRLGGRYPLPSFRPETDYPGNSKQPDMARGYRSLELYVSSLDTYRDAAPWVWSGYISAIDAAQLRVQEEQLLSFLSNTVRIWRTLDNAWIDIYFITNPTVITASNRRKDVTFIVAPRRLSWRRESTRLYSEGVYGEGIYAGGEFEESY